MIYRILLFLSLALTASAEIIPASRRMTWTVGTNVGVQGGIPNRTTVGATADAATYGTGTVDASAEVSRVVTDTPEGQVAYFPAGTYRMDSHFAADIYDSKNKTIRGELGPSGERLTIFKANISYAMFTVGEDPDSTAVTHDISSGATAGSTSFTIASTSGMVAGRVITVSRDDQPHVLHSLYPETNLRLQAFQLLITAVPNGTTVEFAPALPFAMTGNPKMTYHATPSVIGLGFEDLVMDGNAMQNRQIFMQNSANCWMKNVEIKNSTGRNIVASKVVFFEFRKNYLHSTTTYGSNHEGFDMTPSSFTLIEDNILYEIGGMAMSDSGGGSTGNVIGYNFIYGNAYDSVTAIADIFGNHSPHNSYNLYEGNIAGGFHNDGYYGSDEKSTLLRNWLTGTHSFANNNRIALALGRWSNYNNVIGNVLGTSAFPDGGEIFKIGYPNLGNWSTNGRTWGPTTPPDYTAQFDSGSGLISGGGDSFQERDLNVNATLALHGNYDYETTNMHPRYGTAGFVTAPAQRWELSNANVTDYTDQNIPDSYYTTKADLEARGVVFGTLSFPVINPASPPGAFNDTNLARLPAGYRFVNGVDPGAGGAANVTIGTLNVNTLHFP